MAPELIHQNTKNTERVDDRADMFALGAIAYRALTDTLPFNPVATNVPYLAARTHQPNTPRELATIIDSLLSVDRFDQPSATKMRTELDWLLVNLPELQQHATPHEPKPEPESKSKNNIKTKNTPTIAPRTNTNISHKTPHIHQPH